MILRKELEIKIDTFLSNHNPITEGNAREVINFLLRYKSEWVDINYELYAQIILIVGEAYRIAETINKSICFLEEQIEQYEQTYPNTKKYKSLMYFNLGKYYAHTSDKEKAYVAFEKHIYYFLMSDTNYVGFSLYSYRSCNEYTLGDLRNNTMTMVNPQKFNDPMDCLVFPWFKYRNSITEELQLKNITESFIKLYSHIKVRCFVKNKPFFDEEGIYDKNSFRGQYEPLMWAHYADMHKGFCIRYKMPSEVTSANINKNFTTGEVSRLDNVEYVPTIDLTKQFSIKDFFFKKSKVWKYEHEVRLVHYDPNCNEDYKAISLPQGCVKDIYFGLNCEDDNIQKIRDTLKGQDVTFHQIETQPQDYYKLTSRLL